jgi:hypothetical protein
MAEFAADDVSEQIQLLTPEAYHLKLLDRREVGDMLWFS